MVIALLVLMLGSAIPQQAPGDADREKTSKPPKRGDVVVARGCLKGGVLESASVGWPEGVEQFGALATYRLTGDKKTLEAIRKEHDGHADIVTGELRTDLPTSIETRGKKVGNTRIVVGVGSSRGMMPPPPPPMPVLRVTGLEHTDVPCR